MKYVLLIICFMGSLSINAQTNSHAGTYTLSYANDSNVIVKWTLSLNLNGTFLYNFYRNLNCAICTDENFYGKGTWIAEKNIISFTSDEKADIDEIHTMNFKNTKARINRKSPRNISNKNSRESIIFFKSELFTIQSLELFKSN